MWLASFFLSHWATQQADMREPYMAEEKQRGVSVSLFLAYLEDGKEIVVNGLQSTDWDIGTF